MPKDESLDLASARGGTKRNLAPVQPGLPLGIDLKEVDFPLPKNAQTRVEACGIELLGTLSRRLTCGHDAFLSIYCLQDARHFRGANVVG